MKRASFAGAVDEEEGSCGGELAVAASPHHRLHQPTRSCLKDHHHGEDGSTSSSSSSTAPAAASPLASLHHHVHFLSSSGTSIGSPQTAPASTHQLVVIDLDKLRSQSSQGATTLRFRCVPPPPLCVYIKFIFMKILPLAKPYFYSILKI
jgi:hypothetical protein